ncbi:DUF938 domain-containing protein [uncultured Ramlibacter sp.]|uniref:DUF938 domain-containing protein n=1 Tax=uncultured Ramlibacter sp. TaxID=260755 RepID=UPI00261CAA90|nr:DUF938 domain-containing protein [uncultured Ramlibacter sp.]
MHARHSGAAERNREPIAQALRQLLPARGQALEIASGTGQHVAWFAAALPGWSWQPSDADPTMLASIAAWCAQAGVGNVLAPLQLDVASGPWPVEGQAFDAVFCANMLHISPWASCAGLMQGAARVLAPGGLLLTYGPYWEDGVAPAPSNLAFDASLRERDPAWGIRRMADVEQQAGLAGLQRTVRLAMPANNLLLAFARVRPAPAP